MRNSALIWSNDALTLPSQLSLTGSFRDWTGTSPWAGEASLGTSGSNTASDGGTVTTFLLNGHNAALLDSTPSAGADRFTLSGTTDTYFNSTTLSGWFLIYADSVSISNSFGIAGVDGTGVCVTFFVNTNGLSQSTVVLQLNNDPANAQVQCPFTAQAWQLVTFRWDGTTIQIGVNSPPGSSAGASQKAYSTALSSLTPVFQIGAALWTGNSSLQGKMADVGLSDTVLTDAQFNGIKAYVNWRYGLSL